MANSKITNLTSLTAASGDEIPVNRAGSDGKITLPLPVAAGGTGQVTAAEALGEMTQALTEDTAPDQLADYFMTYDASADTGKKVLYRTVGRRRVTTANSITYYVRTTGNDSNDGLTVGSPKLTIQSAMNDALRDIDAAVKNNKINIDVGAGTFPDEVAWQCFGTPRHWFEITGDSEATTTIGAVYVSRGEIELANLTIAHGNTHLLWLDHFAFIYCGPNVTLSGAGSQDGAFCVSDSHLNLDDVTFSGTFACGLSADLDGTIQLFSNINANSCTWNDCGLKLSNGSVFANHGCSWTGTATGRRFEFYVGSKFYAEDTAGNDNLNFVPGSTSGQLYSGSFFATGVDDGYNEYYGVAADAAGTAIVNGGDLAEVIGLHSVASAVNELAVYNSTTGAAPSLRVTGGDAAIDLALIPKSTGLVSFGAFSSTASEVITGYVTIKDSAGNKRKLAVIA